MKRATAALALLAALSASGCATTGRTDSEDPFEATNRASFEFNGLLDRKIVAPVARVYADLTPRGVRRGIGNFFSNLGYPNVIVNDFLQGKFEQGFEDTGRFIFNSTLGLGGLIDIAGPLGLEAHDEDIGQTLAVWGIDAGPYLELPFFGPYTLRGAGDLPFSAATNPIFYLDDPPVLATLLLGVVDERAGLFEEIAIRDQALDPYVFQREAFLQQRRYLIFDGEPPADADDLDALDPLSPTR